MIQNNNSKQIMCICHAMSDSEITARSDRTDGKLMHEFSVENGDVNISTANIVL